MPTVENHSTRRVNSCRFTIQKGGKIRENTPPGPYLVVRRLSDLNYEVKMPRGSSDKTEKVHVVNIKKFNMPILNPTRDPPYEPSKQDTRTETTKHKLGRPWKLIAPAPEPHTTTAEPMSPPISQPEEQPIMSPQKRRSMTRRKPKRYNVLLLYLVTTFLGHVRSDFPLTEGVYKKKKKGYPVTYSNPDWIILTEVTFSHMNKVS